MLNKLLSVLLCIAVSASALFTVTISASADTDSDGNYVPAEGTDTYRYYFYMPQSWENEYTNNAGIYWWEGTDACPSWQDMYKIKETECENIFYIDAPQDVAKIIFTNYIDCGDPAESMYTKATQTFDITCVDSDGEEAWGYWPKTDFYDPDNDLYPEGIKNFDNMIYVIDYNKTEENPLNGKLIYCGQWYYYYGSGEYGYTPVKGDGAVYNTEYMSFKQALADKNAGENPSQPETTVAPETTVTPETTVAPETTIEPTTAPTTVPSSVFTVCATSNIFPQTKAEYNSSTKRVTVTYYLGTARDIVNLEWYLTFDNTVLDYNKSNNYDVSANKLNIMPQITPFGGDVIDTSFLGKISANASNLSLYSIDSAKPFVQVTFDVIGEPENIETTVNLNVRTLTTAEYGNDTETPDFSIINSFVDNYILNDSAELTFANTVLTDTTNGLIEWKNLSDENTNISVSGVVNSNADLNVSKLENTYEKSVATYDITLQKDGIAIQPDGAITIKIPSDVKDCKVMWLKGDGTAEDMNAKYTDGCYVFTTDHLSVYALVLNKTILTGDANQDGIIDVNDVTYLQIHIAGNKNTDGSAFIDETNKQLFDCIDMNKDGKLSVADVTALQIYISQNN
ncbi:hypothetical protein [Ruminococcus sp.]|uniref:hypothetical protein n=1 Tax=Ruminococcus sp. TaxID=41978 RepID=UPI003AAEECE7